MCDINVNSSMVEALLDAQDYLNDAKCFKSVELLYTSIRHLLFAPLYSAGECDFSSLSVTELLMLNSQHGSVFAAFTIKVMLATELAYLSKEDLREDSIDFLVSALQESLSSVNDCYMPAVLETYKQVLKTDDISYLEMRENLNRLPSMK